MLQTSELGESPDVFPALVQQVVGYGLADWIRPLTINPLVEAQTAYRVLGLSNRQGTFPLPLRPKPQEL